MKEDELREAAECAVCRRPFGHTGIPIFWRITVARHGVKLRTIVAQDGLAQMLGSSALAAAMGPDEDMTVSLGKPKTMTVCEACMQGKMLALYALLEGGE